MSFKTMDGVTVYDKQDVDNLLEPVAQNAADAKQEATALNNRKADRSEMNLEFSADRQRITALETDKANKAEIPAMVASTIDDIITAKVQAVVSDINHIVDNAVNDAVADIPNPGVATTAEVQSIVNQYF